MRLALRQQRILIHPYDARSNCVIVEDSIGDIRPPIARMHAAMACIGIVPALSSGVGWDQAER